MKQKFIEVLKERTGREVVAKEMEKGLGISIVGDANVPIPVFYWEMVEHIAKEKGVDHVVDMYIDYLERAKEEVKLPKITADYIRKNVHSGVRRASDNNDILKDIIYDYEVYYVLVIAQDEESRQSIKLTRKMLKNMGLTFDEVRECANNNDFEQFEFMNIGEMFGAGLTPMWVVTNKAKSNGASVVFVENVIEKIMEKIGDFVVLPSSIHEVIVMPIEYANLDMIEMVKEINRTTVADEDVLGDTILKCVNGKFEVFE